MSGSHLARPSRGWGMRAIFAAAQTSPRIHVASSELKQDDPPPPDSPRHNSCCLPSMRPPSPEFRGVPRFAAPIAGVMPSRDGAVEGSGAIVPRLRILV